MESIEKVAEVVLFEGYLLYPYTRSTTKNQQRWTFGGVYPRPYSESNPNDPWLMQTECLVLGDAQTEIEVKLRYLQVMDRTVIDAAGEEVDELRVGDHVYRPWDESIERQHTVGPLSLRQLVDGVHQYSVVIEAGQDREPLVDSAGQEAGALLRNWQSLHGVLELAGTPLPEGCYRIRATVSNVLPWLSPAAGRPDVLRHTFVSTHTILRVDGGEFVSLLDPPRELEKAARECVNIKTWPVLAGPTGEKQILLSSPIILYDYPQVAPESPGNLFDATEIDELLTLSVLTLTDEEKQEMWESDPRGREILERTETLAPEEIMKMHGVIRSMRQLRPEDT